MTKKEPKYVVFKSNTFDVANEVYFAYSWNEAQDLWFDKFWENPEADWALAAIVTGSNSWMARVIRWAQERFGK